MQDLVEFLIENRYCDTEASAIKILEYSSDNFYDYIAEAQLSAIDLTAKARKDMASELTKAGTPGFNAKKVRHMRKKIDGLRGPASTELAQRSTKKTSQPTPGGGSRAQTKDIGITRLNSPRVKASADNFTNQVTGTRPEVSIPGTAQTTNTIGHGKYTNNSGNPNKGRTRTGDIRPKA
jgi:hypothetical protein